MGSGACNIGVTDREGGGLVRQAKFGGFIAIKRYTDLCNVPQEVLNTDLSDLFPSIFEAMSSNEGPVGKSWET